MKTKLTVKSTLRSISVFLCLLFLTTGCRTLKYGWLQPYGGGESKIVPLDFYAKKEGQTKQLPSINWAYYNAMYRSSYFYVSPSGESMVISEVQPDAATAIVGKFIAEGKYEDLVTGKLQSEFARSVNALGERTPGVNIVRDGTYRISEMAFNRKVGSNQIPAMLSNVLSAAENIEKSHMTTATERAKADTARFAAILEYLKKGGDPKTVEQVFGLSLANATNITAATNVAAAPTPQKSVSAPKNRKL